MISSKDILNGNDGLSFHRYSSGYGREANYDGLSFPSPRLLSWLYTHQGGLLFPSTLLRPFYARRWGSRAQVASASVIEVRALPFNKECQSFGCMRPFDNYPQTGKSLPAWPPRTSSGTALIFFCIETITLVLGRRLCIAKRDVIHSQKRPNTITLVLGRRGPPCIIWSVPSLPPRQFSGLVTWFGIAAGSWHELGHMRRWTEFMTWVGSHASMNSLVTWAHDMSWVTCVDGLVGPKEALRVRLFAVLSSRACCWLHMSCPREEKAALMGDTSMLLSCCLM
jgi:hypothetical protein